MRGKLLISCLIFCTTFAFGQIGSLYPDQLSSYFYNPSFINPAYIPEDGSGKAAFLSKVRSGMYSDIMTLGAGLQQTFNSEGNQWHSVKVLLLNEKEGPYISTPRFYGNYSIYIPINRDMKLLGGFSLGMVNPNYTTPSRTISTVLVDGAIGVLLRYKTSALGVSSNQILNNSSTDNSAIRLRRYYSTQFSSTKALNHNTAIKINLAWWYFTDIPSQLTGSTSILLDNTIEVGGGYHNINGLFMLAAFTADSEGKHPLTIGALYNSTFLAGNNVLGASLEFNVSYGF